MINYCRFQKYYKSLFLGLLDMVLVNCFIIYNLALKKRRQAPMDHNTFFRQMQAAMVQVTAEDFTAGLRRKTAPARSAGTVTSTGHKLEEANDIRVSGSTPDVIKQKRQRACKVCSMLKVSYRVMH